MVSPNSEALTRWQHYVPVGTSICHCFQCNVRWEVGCRVYNLHSHEVITPCGSPGGLVCSDVPCLVASSPMICYGKKLKTATSISSMCCLRKTSKSAEIRWVCNNNRPISNARYEINFLAPTEVNESGLILVYTSHNSSLLRPLYLWYELRTTERPKCESEREREREAVSNVRRVSQTL